MQTGFPPQVDPWVPPPQVMIKEFADSVRPAVEALPGKPGFDRQKVLDLYPPQTDLDALVKDDREVFQSAMRLPTISMAGST